ncbi:MAG: zf-HC2 domain-containing protein [Anaerolineae bacterium]
MTTKFDDSPAGKPLDNNELVKLEAALRTALYRQDCPEVMVLGEYQLGLLAEVEVARLAAHLEHCPHCQAELARLADFLAEEISWQPGEGFRWRWVKETGQLIIQVVGETLDNVARWVSQPPVDQLAYGSLRSEGPDRSVGQLALLKAVEDLEVIIMVETMPRQTNHCAITVQINIPSRGGWPNLAGTEVTLKRNEVKLTTHITNAFGQTIFEGIPTADFTQLSFELLPAGAKSEA